MTSKIPSMHPPESSTDKKASRQRSPVAEAVSLTKMTVRAGSDMRHVLNTLLSLKPQAIEKLTPAEARQEPTVTDAMIKYLEGKGRETSPEKRVPGVSARDIVVDCATSSLPATVYTPEGQGPFPLIVYYHGGGFVIADRKVYDGGARGLASQARAVVISADYRQAPEHKFPAAHDDAWAVYEWAATHGAALGGDPRRIALAGESAGGNLALATALAAAKVGLSVPRHVLAVYPVTQPDIHTHSYDKYADAKPLNRPMMQWFVGHYISSPTDTRDWRLDLAHADLQGLPPVTLINAEIDPLLDDGAMMEQALREAGVPVERRVYKGVAHEFFGAAVVIRKAAEAQAYAAQRLNADLRDSRFH
ncbi:alpha/beta hydrolase [Solimonas sp. SE-A11]|uniref:alpha/beta hydrolase n=1 Tax=Solimonas sp. SE-A11 TaxID=3054954 RepID=UPI00259CEFA1|nr:alpha/beta hydrolase [Solimonas sp. SE-A11]MDM4772725.1 alpha/beta hydrolase [Solimonas sp. SE-A11]